MLLVVIGRRVTFQASLSTSEIVDLHRNVRFGAFCVPSHSVGVMFEGRWWGLLSCGEVLDLELMHSSSLLEYFGEALLPLRNCMMYDDRRGTARIETRKASRLIKRYFLKRRLRQTLGSCQVMQMGGYFDEHCWYALRMHEWIDAVAADTEARSLDVCTPFAWDEPSNFQISLFGHAVFESSIKQGCLWGPRRGLVLGESRCRTRVQSTCVMARRNSRPVKGI